MAVAYIGNGVILCLSTDTKPTTYPANTVAIETDTGDIYTYTTGSGWLNGLRNTGGNFNYYTVYIDPVDSKFRARNNVTGKIDYVSSGTTDATSVIQSAINAAAGLGGVFFAAGTYPVTGTSPVCITIPSNSKLIGASWDAKIAASTQIGVFGNVTRSGAGNSDITIENLWIDGGWDGTSAQTSDNCGILLDFVTDVFVTRCKVTNAKAEGIKCRNSTRATIQQCYVNKTPLGCGGMLIASSSSYGKIVNNTAVDCGGESYSAVADATAATNNVIIANNLGYVTSTSQNVRGHLLIESTGSGLGVNDTVVANNTIVAGFANGIIVTNNPGNTNVSRNLIIANNVITHYPGQTSYPASPSNAAGIVLSCYGVDITGNVIHDVLGSGIITSSGNSRINITNNIIRNVGLNQVGSTGYVGPYDGIVNTSTGAALLDNLISNNIILDENTNMRYGINMAGTAAHTNILIQGNSIRGNQSNPSISLGAYSSTTNCYVTNNSGFNDFTDFQPSYRNFSNILPSSGRLIGVRGGWQGSGPTTSGFGLLQTVVIGNGTGTSSGTGVDTVDGPRAHFLTGTNNTFARAGWWSTTTHIMRKYNPVFSLRFRLSQTISTGSILYIGLVNQTAQPAAGTSMLNTYLDGKIGVLFGWRSTDTTPMIISNNAIATATYTSVSGIWNAGATDTSSHTLTIYLDDANARIHWWFDGVPQTDITNTTNNVPPSTTSLAVLEIQEAQTATGQDWYEHWSQLSMDWV